MILATRHSGNMELRFGPNTAVAPFRTAGFWSSAGETVTQDKAVGLPAVGRAVRLVAGVVASLPLNVYEGRGGDRVERPDTRPAALLANPVAGVSDFDWRWDVASALEATENAFLLKIRAGAAGVVELQPIPPDLVYGHVDPRTGAKLFDVWTASGRTTLTTLDVLHIRGQTVGGGPFGVSRITQHADPVGAMLAAQRFEGSFFRNNARPDFVMEFPQGVTVEQGRAWKQEWDAQMAGAGNAGQSRAIGGGAKVTPVPVSFHDAQFVEGRHLGIQDVGRIMDVDPALLGATENTDVRRTALELFLKLQLPPRLRRIEGALRADLDLFQLGAGLYPQFQVDDLMFSDPLTRAQVQHYRVQDGTELVDEARADNGRPPLPDGAGQIPQITPVGGAPNPALEPAPKE